VRALQRRRLVTRAVFFALFVLAPPLDLFRLDLTRGHFIVLGQPWTLGLDAFVHGQSGAAVAALHLFVRAFLPAAGVVALFAIVAWNWGRVYCGWLCPHFSVVELINRWMRRARGTPTLWEPRPIERGTTRASGVHGAYWVPTVLSALALAFLWALTLLTYLLPPSLVYGNLVSATLTRNEALFLGIGTLVFATDFLFARHLFCRFGCAVGLFQSFVWMANKKALVVGYDRSRAAECRGCGTSGTVEVDDRSGNRRSKAPGGTGVACEAACPMRLTPRTIKRLMFSCTQCAQCLSACADVQEANSPAPLLQWVRAECALDVSDRDFGHRPVVAKNCYRTPVAASTAPCAEG
jgi:ferredoxin-type protein NapH